MQHGPTDSPAGAFDRATREAYGTAATVWERGPELVYRHLSAALLGAAPVPLRGALLLDVGAATGVLGDLAAAAGARCVEVDSAAEMLARQRQRRRHAVAADARRQPFAAATFDVVTAACSLSHVDDPELMLAEARRVLRPDGVLLVSAFPEGRSPHPVRAATEDALVAAGYRPPSWYVNLKETGERRVGSAEALRSFAAAAEFTDIAVSELVVDTGIADSGALVDYRLGMAQHAPFLASLDEDGRRAVRKHAVRLLGPSPPPLSLALLVLVARA